MYTNVAYLNNQLSAVEDRSKSLIVTSCGYYRVDSEPMIETNRPKGRIDYQLLYIAEGKAHFYFNGIENIVNKGDMVLFRPYQEQIYFYYPEDKCQVYWAHFTGNEVEAILDYYQFPETKNVFYSGLSPEYQWFFEQMIGELQLCRVNYQDLLAMYLRNLFLLINRNLKEGGKSVGGALNEIERSIRYFNEHYTEEINVEEYARSLHISSCWFNRRFKQVAKITPLQYVISVRLANAKVLLQVKNYNVKETAYAVGFNNPLYFSKLFTKKFGISPIFLNSSRLRITRLLKKWSSFIVGSYITNSIPFALILFITPWIELWRKLSEFAFIVKRYIPTTDGFLDII